MVRISDAGEAVNPSTPTKRRALFGALALLVAIAASACAEAKPQDALDPAGPFARQSDDLWNLTFGIAAVVFVIVEGLLIFAIIKFRHKPGRSAAQWHGNTKLEIILTAVPALILAGLAVPTVRTIFDLSRKSPDALQVTVVGHQFWWEYQYTDLGFKTANELYVPVDKDVELTLSGATDNGFGEPEVIHSFWIPRITSGSQDIIPGRANFIKLRADEVDTFRGQCKEFCGLSHANMKIVAHSLPQTDFDQWARDQAAPAQEGLTGDAAAGQKFFSNGPCVQCHAVDPGLEAQPSSGPNLAHFGSRNWFAGAAFENNTENLSNWLRDPPAMKPGSRMPDYGLTEQQIQELVAYLQSLE
jgi:cytochrome c oxidase subunit II